MNAAIPFLGKGYYAVWNGGFLAIRAISDSANKLPALLNLDQCLSWDTQSASVGVGLDYGDALMKIFFYLSRAHVHASAEYCRGDANVDEQHQAWFSLYLKFWFRRIM